MQEEGAEISLTGSITLCHALIAAGLVDEYRLWTYPYVQGRGRRLFPEGFQQRLEPLEQTNEPVAAKSATYCCGGSVC